MPAGLRHYGHVTIEDRPGLPRYVGAVTKTPLSGLVVRRVGDVAGRAGDLGGVVVDMHWSDLQPGGQDTPIDTTSSGASGWTQLAAAKATGLPIKLRVHAGQYSPAWALSLAGTFTIGDPDNSNRAVVVPKWWTSPFLAAWGGFMAALAVLVEGDAQIREIASHPATTIFAEPFIRNQRGSFGGVPNLQIMVNNGLTKDLDLAAYRYPADLVGTKTRWETYGFATTRYYVPFNPYVYWSGKTVNDLSVTLDAMNYLAKNLGPHCVIGNNSVRTPLWRSGGAWFTGTAQAGGTSTITLDGTVSPAPTASALIGSWIALSAGTGSNPRQWRTITAYDATSRVATVNAPWSVIPNATSAYKYATPGVMANNYQKMYAAMNGLNVCLAIQQGNNTQVPAAWNEIPGHSTDTPLQALIATTSMGLNYLPDFADVPPAVMTAGLVLRYRYQEIPSNWDVWGLSSAKAAFYNDLSAGMPIGV